MAHDFIFLWFNEFELNVERDGSLSTLCHNCGFVYQHRLLETFPGPGYLCFEDGIIWLWHLVVNFYVYCSPFDLATAQFL